MNNKNQKAVVLLSGGMDSAVTLAFAAKQGFSIYALSINYNQRHKIELLRAKIIAEKANVIKHIIFDLDLSIFGGSSLTDNIDVPKGPRLSNAPIIPPTYVPARNTIFLSLAVSWAESIGARDVFIGVSSVDYSGYPDCRPDFITQFEKTINLGTRAVDNNKLFRVNTPLLNLDKGKTVELGMSLGVDFSSTWSCYDPLPGNKPCGSCEACSLRALGFSKAKIIDPSLKGQFFD